MIQVIYFYKSQPSYITPNYACLKLKVTFIVRRDLYQYILFLFYFEYSFIFLLLLIMISKKVFLKYAFLQPHCCGQSAAVTNITWGTVYLQNGCIPRDFWAENLQDLYLLASDCTCNYNLEGFFSSCCFSHCSGTI